MAIINFIPTVWSESLTRSLNQEYVGVSHCNRDFEGEIKNCGSSVKICHVNDVRIYDYDPECQIMSPESIDKSISTLTVDRARYFNFLIDDIDRVQKSPKLMDMAMRAAAHSLAMEADNYIFSLYTEAGTHLTHNNTTPENILEPLYQARTLLQKAGVTDMSQVVFEVSPAVATLLLQSKMLIAHDNTATLETGSVGSILGIPVFVSNNIAHMPDNSNTSRAMCLLRTRRAIAFAEQLSLIEAYRPDTCFADAVKGLHLYGAQVVCPQELICLNYQVSDN